MSCDAFENFGTHFYINEKPKFTSTADLIRMTEFVLRNTYFEF